MHIFSDAAVKVVGPSIAAVAALIAFVSLLSNIRFTRAYKQTDIILDCVRRTEALLRLDAELRKSVTLDLPGASEEAAESYYRLYWNLRSDEWFLYRMGMLPLPLARRWFSARSLAFHRDGMRYGVTFRQGWERYGKPPAAGYDDFIAFVDELAGNRESNTTEREKLVGRRLTYYFERYRNDREEILGLVPWRRWLRSIGLL